MAAEVRFAAVRKMLEQAGYRLVRIRGSHHYFAKLGELPLSIPVHRGKVKAHYVRQVEKVCKGP
jgi:predicted RNA binding protein YcfA (HicA-like mRNA interferase family)